MRNILLLLALILLQHQAWAGCSSPISRINNTPNQKLTSTKYNQDLNTVYSKVNNLSGDCITDETVTTSKIADSAITAEKIAAGVIAQFIPAGSIMPYAGTVAPTGYLLCNGQAVSRTTYADLYAVVGNAFGSGNGSTTFNLPDFRGRFLRGVDGGAGRDPDRLTRTAMNPGGNAADTVGSVQADAFKNHAHTTYGLAENAGTGPTLLERFHDDNSVSGSWPTSSVGGSETRPVNANVNFIIKY